MRIAIIGRGENLMICAKRVAQEHDVVLVITAKEAPEYIVKSVDYQSFANEVGAKFIYTPRINEQEVLEQIDALQPIDVAISINYSGVIAESVISKFRYGILNAHGGDLPRYRGNACQAWAIINGEQKIALCIHKMIGGELDSGPIIDREYMSISENTRVGEVYNWFDSITADMMVNSIKRLSKDPNYALELQSTDPSHALRCYPRKPEDGLIDWSMSAESIVRLINASSEPYSGAFTTVNGEKELTIWRAERYFDDENYLAVSGQVAAIEQSGDIIVITGDGKVKITEVSVGGERLKPNEVIKSIRTWLK